MNDNRQSYNSHRESNTANVHKMQRPYWKRMHHDWRFWIALLLTLTAMMIYVVSEDFAWLSRGRLQSPHATPAENSGTR
jgi:hypothetical protein